MSPSHGKLLTIVAVAFALGIAVLCFYLLVDVDRELFKVTIREDTRVAAPPTRAVVDTPVPPEKATSVTSLPQREATAVPTPRETVSVEPTPTPHPQELRRFEDASWLSRNNPEVYNSIASLGWVSDGISSKEADSIQALIYLGIDAPDAAEVLMKTPWLADGIVEDEAWVVTSISYVAYDTPDVASELIGMSWLADGVDANESWAVSSLVYIAEESPVMARQLISKSWYADGIGEDDSLVVEMLGSIAHATGSASKFVQMPFLDSIEPADHFALGSLATLGQESPDVFRSVLSHPTVADGITDDEAAVVALVYDVHATNPDLVDTILDPVETRIEERVTDLPLAGEMQLAIVRTQPGADRSMDVLEDVTRFVESYMGEPFPKRLVLLLYADAVLPGFAGHNVGTNMIIHPDFDTDDGSEEAQQAAAVLAHEVAHYYWSNSAEAWLDEGAAEIMAVIYEESQARQRMMGVNYAGSLPCTYASDLSSLEDLTGTAVDDCTYSLGTRFFLDLYDTLEPHEFQKGFRALYLAGKDAIDPEGPNARRIDEVMDAYSFSSEAVSEVIPRWYWSDP